MGTKVSYQYYRCFKDSADGTLIIYHLIRVVGRPQYRVVSVEIRRKEALISEADIGLTRFLDLISTTDQLQFDDWETSVEQAIARHDDDFQNDF